MSIAMCRFTIKKFQETMQSLPRTPGYLVAYSGGMDSHVLLHALHSMALDPAIEIRVVHINHGLSKQAGTWQEHCRVVCDSMGLEFKSAAIHLEQGGDLEARARELRYQVLAGHLQPGHVLLTAHHMDDQAETMLLQLLRGAGPDGLAGMPVTREFAPGRHTRPFLGFRRRDLLEYARTTGLQWVDDETNQDLNINRNFIRHRILPELSSHWPGVIEVLNRAAANQADCSQLQDCIGDIDLHEVRAGSETSIDLVHLGRLSGSRQRNVIRYWLKSMSLPVPGSKLLEQIFTDLVNAGADAAPVINWAGREIRRYRDRMFIIKPMPPAAGNKNIPWNLRDPMVLELGRLQASPDRGMGLKASLCKGRQIEVRYREGGESIHLPGKAHHQSLKNMFQEAGVPPWYRDYIPLLYLDGDLAAVSGLWIDEKYLAAEDEDSWRISWDKQGLVFGNSGD